MPGKPPSNFGYEKMETREMTPRAKVKKAGRETYEVKVLLTNYRLMGNRNAPGMPEMFGAEITAVTTGPVDRDKLSRSMLGRPLRARLVVDLTPEEMVKAKRGRRS